MLVLFWLANTCLAQPTARNFLADDDPQTRKEALSQAKAELGKLSAQHPELPLHAIAQSLPIQYRVALSIQDSSGHMIWYHVRMDYFFHDDSLSAADPRILNLLEHHPLMLEYNLVRAMSGYLLARDGAHEEGVKILKSVVAEERKTPSKEETGYFACMHLAEILIATQDYQAAIEVVALTETELSAWIFCGNAKWDFRAADRYRGVAYAGLGMRDSALKFLLPMAFDDYPYSKSHPTLAIDTLIALLQRIDSTPLLMQLDEAIANLEYKVEMPDPRIPREQLFICAIQLGGYRLRAFQTWDNSPVHFGQRWQMPMTREACQGFCRRSPLYRRLSGVPAEEVYRWH